MLKTLGQRIKELRLKADLSLRELSEKLEKKPSAAHLSDIELGNRFPADDLLDNLARVLKTTLDDLRKYDQRPPTKEMQDLITQNAQYGFAFRSFVEKVRKEQIPPDEIIKRFNDLKQRGADA